MKKYFFSLFFMVLSLSGCSDKTKDSEGKIVINFWHSFVSSTVPALNKLIEKFEAENPAIKINAQYVPTGDALIQKLITSVQSNTAPDICWIHSDWMDKLVNANAIYKMNHFISGSNGLSNDEINDIFPELLKAAKFNDTLYALPMEATVLALVYNKDHFKAAGLNPDSPPGNWKELYEYAAKLTIDKNDDGYYDQYGFYIPALPASGPLSVWMNLQWTPFLWQAGGKEINDEQTEVLFNSKAGVDALALWKKIFDMEKFRNYSFTHDMGLASGSISMIMDGPWDLPRFREMKNINWAVSFLPAGPERKVTYIAGEHLVIFKQSKFPDKTWEFAKWVIQPENQMFFSMESGYLPVRKSVLDLKEYQDFLNKDQAMKSFVDQLQIGQGRSQINKYKVEINQFLAEAIEKTLVGNVDPKTALDEAAEKSNRLLKNN